MKKSLRLIVTLFVVLSFVITGCGSSASKIQEAIAQTQTAYPTSTPTNTPQPTPTSTPIPTATPLPTATPIPLILGIDIPISFGTTTLLFTSAELFEGEVTIGSNILTPNSGRSVLVLKGTHTGGFDTTMKSLVAKEGEFYISDIDNLDRYKWKTAYFKTDSTFIFGFFVMTNKAPYILNNTLGDDWTLDLSPLFD